MNAKQVSKDNPGWIGTGVPTLAQLTLHQVRPVVHLIISGQRKTAKHRLIALAADMWNFYSWWRSTNRVRCPCCGWRGPAFLATSNWRTTTFQSKCPQCDSRSRHRGLIELMPSIMDRTPQGDILFFAPELVLLQELNGLAERIVITTDFNSTDVDFSGEDIQDLSFPSDSFALIICNHVLEHVADDQRALGECARVLKPGGIAVFTIPGNFDTHETWHFDKRDSNGHFRHYGLDVVRKMEKAFFEVEAIDMGKVTIPESVVRMGDFAFVCVK